MKKTKMFAAGIAACAAMLVGFASCGGEKTGSAKGKDAGKAAEAADYQYGVDTLFHSDTPVTYSISFSDASWYPMVDTWKTEGIF